MSDPCSRTDALLLAVLDRVGADADQHDREWTDAVCAEAAALSGAARRRWLAGGVWFIARRRRATPTQRVCAFAGLAFSLLLALVGVTDLRDDAGSWAASSDVMLLTGTGLLAGLFAVALVRPLCAILASPAFLGYGVLTMAARQIEVGGVETVIPPPGMTAQPTGLTGVLGLALAAIALLGPPVVALTGVALGGGGRRRDATSS